MHVPLKADDLPIVTGEDEYRSLVSGDKAPPTMGVDENSSRGV